MDWIYRTLTRIFGPEQGEKIADRIISIENEKELENFAKTVLDLKNPQHNQFYTGVKKQLFAEQIKKQVDKDKIKEKSKKKKNNQKSTKNQNDSTERVRCGCNAQIHDLFKNCIKCGLILCVKEGPGPCFFCNENIDQNALKIDMFSKSDQQAFVKAIELRDRLIKFDQLAEMRKIIDDQRVFYDMTSSKLSKEQRMQFMSRVNNMMECYEKSKESTILNTSKDSDFELNRKTYRISLEARQQALISNNEYYKNMIDKISKLSVKDERNEVLTAEDISNHEEFDDSRCIAEIGEFFEQNVAIAIKQPYASFIVLGYKFYQSWCFPLKFRGLVWLIALPSNLSQSEIELEEKKILKNLDINRKDSSLPNEYPTNCILGQTFLKDCIDSEEFNRKYPFETTAENYNLIFDNAKEMKKAIHIKKIKNICEYFFLEKPYLNILISSLTLFRSFCFKYGFY